MQYWLFKSEPTAWSWEQQVAAGAKGTAWEGVRNHQAKINLTRMRRGDRGFFYQSNEGKQIVGLVEVIREHYPDPSARAGEPWVAVDLKALGLLRVPVTLATIKNERRLSQMKLVTSSRLSVQPVTTSEWTLVCKMGGLTKN